MSKALNHARIPQYENIQPKQDENITPSSQSEVKHTTKQEFNIENAYKLYCYNGTRILLGLKRFKRKSKVFFLNLLESIMKKLVIVSNFAGKQFEKSINSFFGIFKKFVHSQQKNKALIKTKVKNPVLEKTLLILAAIKDSFTLAIKLILPVLNYVAPVVALGVLVYTINFFGNVSYGLKVSLNGETLGYIDNEKIYQTAEKMMQERIYYNENDKALYTTPSYNLVVKNEDSFLSEDELCDKIILASSNDITGATGLYIDGKFYGATDKPDVLQQALDSVKNKYKAGIEGENINFVQDVSQKQGYYLSGSIQDIDSLVDVITGDVQGRETYVVKEGDTPSGIAQSLKIKTAELMSLNPGIDKALFPGDELIVKNSKPFLEVESRAIKTYQSEVAFEKEVVEDSSKSVGYTNILQTGENGIVEYTAEFVYKNGVQTDKIVLKQDVIKEAVPQKTLVGTKVITASGAKNISYADIKTSGQFIWPVASGGKITCGWYGYAGHRAIDIQSFAGDATIASDGGVVISAVYQRYGYGYHVIIQHANGFQTLYAHHSDLAVKAGQTVKQGQVIAYQGRTGNATGVHLHFEIRKNGVQVNPIPYLT